jgi:hypothetical protein
MHNAVRFWMAPALLASLGSAVADAAPIPTPIRAYELNSSLTDAFGGPALVNNGAVLGPMGLAFAANQGPSLSSWLGGSATSGNYSIELYFSITSTASYRKLVDFKNRTADAGVYNLSTSLIFYPVTSGPGGSIVADAMTHFVLTRDGATNAVVGYINGSAVSGISFTDGSSLATFTSPDNIIHFFRDDLIQGSEASAGFVDFIRIYDRTVSAEEAAELYARREVPEPATISTLAGAFFVFCWTRRAGKARQ